MKKTGIALLLGAAVIGLPGGGETAAPADPRGPLVIAHRGASGYLPEHTIEAYELAIRQGADFIEPDLVSTKDGILVARHEVNITDTTDVADRPEFESRKTARTIDGVAETGWFADDFTLAEIKSLRARQRLPFRPQQFNGMYTVPTFAEVVALAKRWSGRTGRAIGVYPETKHPTYHRQRGLPLEEKLAAVLTQAGWNRRDAPVFVQSFEVGNLRRLKTLTRARLVQLIDGREGGLDGSVAAPAPYDLRIAGDPRSYADLITPKGLAEIATYAHGVSFWKRYIVGSRARDDDRDGRADDRNGDGAVDDADRSALPSGRLIEQAHAAGLVVHTWTMRNEGRFLLADYQANPVSEILQFYCLGVDAVFSDFPDSAHTARELHRLSPRACESGRGS